VLALGEGVDQTAAVRIFGHYPSTIACWLKHDGQLDTALHDRFFQKLWSRYIQLDELKIKTRRRGEMVADNGSRQVIDSCRYANSLFYSTTTVVPARITS
jgi:hypothetical protein